MRPIARPAMRLMPARGPVRRNSPTWLKPTWRFSSLTIRAVASKWLPRAFPIESDWNPFIEAGDDIRRVQGAVKEIDCGDKVTRFVVDAGGVRLRLAIDRSFPRADAKRADGICVRARKSRTTCWWSTRFQRKKERME